MTCQRKFSPKRSSNGLKMVQRSPSAARGKVDREFLDDFLGADDLPFPRWPASTVRLAGSFDLSETGLCQPAVDNLKRHQGAAAASRNDSVTNGKAEHCPAFMTLLCHKVAQHLILCTKSPNRPTTTLGRGVPASH